MSMALLSPSCGCEPERSLPTEMGHTRASRAAHKAYVHACRRWRLDPRPAGTAATEVPMHPALSPTPILDLAVAFWGAKTLLSAVELDLFTTLAAGPLDREALTARLQLHPRAARDFLDALVALGMVT